ALEPSQAADLLLVGVVDQQVCGAAGRAAVDATLLAEGQAENAALVGGNGAVQFDALAVGEGGLRLVARRDQAGEEEGEGWQEKEAFHGGSRLVSGGCLAGKTGARSVSSASLLRRRDDRGVMFDDLPAVRCLGEHERVPRRQRDRFSLLLI